MDLYELLGVAKDATIAEIKKAYRKASKLKHPDAGGTADEFKAINEAFEVLSDPAKRKLYDETGETNYEAIEEMTRQLAMGAFDREGDPVVWMREQVKGNIVEHERNRKDETKKVERLRAKLSIFIATNPDASDSAKIVIESIEQRIADFERSVAVATSCIELNKACQAYMETLKVQPVERHPFGTKSYQDLMVGFNARSGMAMFRTST